MDRVLAFFLDLPAWLLYALLGAGAALENIVPPVPADTFVLLGGFLAARGGPDAVTVFLVIWGANVASALFVFWIGLTHGPRYFEHGFGRHLLNPHQAERMRRFYARWGLPAIFLARFLPGLRAVVPGTAGLARMSWWKVAPPMAIASAIWYGGLVWLGVTAGSNLGRIKELLDRVNFWLLLVALAIFASIGVWWWRTRHPPAHHPATGHGP
jgi:membrane protein DedA with SNARE-associated domain